MLSPWPEPDWTLQLVVMGASAGAIEALSVVLPTLPRSYPAPIVVVVHVPADVPSLLADIFAPKCAMAVRELMDKEPLEPGTIYFAPPDYHVLIERDLRASLSADEPENFSRPSIDVLFESAADALAAGVVGVLLTGASADGAKGLGSIRRQGGWTIVQDPSTAYAKAMPTAAVQTAEPHFVVALDGVARILGQLGAREVKS